MAIDFQQIYERIKEIGLSAEERQKDLDEKRAQARILFNEYADNLDGLRKKVDTALLQDANIRCAYPLDENLDTRVRTPDLALDATLIAADGSQIVPDRHAAVQFGLVNVGAIAMQLNSGKTPDIYTDSQLFFGDELITEYGATLSEGMIALRRDLAERTKLAELAEDCLASEDCSSPVITFTDGPIELWEEKDPSSNYEKSLSEYLKALSRLQKNNIITAGYVDKPGANLVVRLLEIIQAPKEKLDKKELPKYHPLLGITDRWLYGEKENPLLKSGERSAVFAIQTKSKKDYAGLLELHFFYLNVGKEGHPYPVRVEIPKWVADDRKKTDMLHAALIQQSRILGGRPFPYLLNRSHEIAVVSMKEKQYIEQIISKEIQKHGGEVDFESNKQIGKNSLSGRRRYKK